MNYLASVTDFFKAPKWVMNLLFSGICIIVAFIGWIALIGWHITGYWGRTDERPETFPEFDTAKLGKYFERGLWPLLAGAAVSLGISLAMKIITWIPSVILGKVLGTGAVIVFGLLMLLVNLVVSLGSFLIVVPVVIQAILTQDFAKAFEMPFIKRFIQLMWLEMLISAIFITVVGLVLTAAGAVLVCVGIPFGLGLAAFASSGIYRQLYRVYLSRGGVPVPASPKLMDEVPFNAPPPAGV